MHGSKLLARQNTTGSITCNVQRICLFRTYHYSIATKLILKQVLWKVDVLIRTQVKKYQEVQG